MNLIKTDYTYFIEDFFDADVAAGFTKNVLMGDTPDDLAKVLNKKIPYAWMKQIHGPKIHHIEKQGKYEGDGLITCEKNLTLVVRTADCLPILMASHNDIAAIHMGWRSAETGILDNLPQDLSGHKVVFGPAMRKCCFEVSEDFFGYKQFLPYIGRRDNKLYFDPVQFAKDSLFHRGLKPQNLFDVNICTICSGGDLFSYRKTKTESRILNFILRGKNR